jgi:hypothetical protein
MRRSEPDTLGRSHNAVSPIAAFGGGPECYEAAGNLAGPGNAHVLMSGPSTSLHVCCPLCLATLRLPSRLPSAHTYVERARCRASRWSAPLYERPGRPVPCLLGLSWVDGRRDGSSPTSTMRGQHARTAPPPSRSLSAPAGGSICDPQLLSALHFPGVS